MEGLCLSEQQGTNKPHLRLRGGSLVLRHCVHTSVVPNMRGTVHPDAALQAEHSGSLYLASPGHPEL